MDDPSATAAGAGGVDVVTAGRPPSYPYLSAVDARRRRRRAGLVSLAIVVGLAVVVGTVLLLTGGHRPAAVVDDAAPSSATTRAATPTTATTSRPPFGGKYVAAPTTAAAAATTPPPPGATLTAALTEVVCNEGAAETATVLSWTATGAADTVVRGPGGQISTLANGNREVVPSRPCAEAPFEDVYSMAVHNAAGTAAAEVTVTWVANAGPD